MKTRPYILMLSIAACVRCLFAGQPFLQSAAEITNCRFASPTSSVPFRLEARITYARKDDGGRTRAIGIEDDSGCQALIIPVGCQKAQALVPGDIAVLSGVVRHSPARPRVDDCTCLQHGPAPLPVAADIADLLTERFHYRLARTTGILRDAVTSETYPRWIMLVVCNGKDRLFISVPKTKDVKSLDHLIGHRISAVGICIPRDLSPRKWFGPTFKVASPSDIAAIGNDDKSIPDIASIAIKSPDEISSLGLHQATGTVIAVWGGRSAIIKAPTDYVGLDFSSGPLPSYGQTIRAVGLPETDLYRINLTRVSWEAVPSAPHADEDAPQLVSPGDIISDSSDGAQVNNGYFGKAIRIRGRILSIPDGGRTGIIHLESGNRVFTADASRCPSALDGVDVGFFVEVAGVCILESNNLHRPSKFPRVRDFLLVLRSPGDIRTISRPSWWTHVRLVFAICILVLLIIAILGWNATLRIAVARKSRALLKEQTAKIEETLKVDERTRLAAELHDYLAQNLTVVSYQISSAQSALQENRADSAKFIENADKMLQSCRTDLRRCLWDLKSDALGEPDFSKAILKTTSLVAGEAAVIVRFDVIRARISDSTAHAILSICRELVSNAVQHGGAKTVRIAGEFKNGIIRFSVRDDGCGFDPAHRQGPGQGHFGLSGIIERIKRLGGQLEIHSNPGNGTRIVATVHNRENK